MYIEMLKYSHDETADYKILYYKNYCERFIAAVRLLEMCACEFAVYKHPIKYFFFLFYNYYDLFSCDSILLVLFALLLLRIVYKSFY